MHPNRYDPERRAEQRAALRRLRRAQLAEARQVAMYLMRTRLTWPLPTRNGAFPATRIGRLLGGRDHSTVLHDVAVIAARLSSGREDDAALRPLVDALAATLDAVDEGAATPRRQAA